MTHSRAVRDQAFELYAQGLSSPEVGRRLGIPRQTVYTWVSEKGQFYLQRRKEDPKHKKRQREYYKKYRRRPESKERKHDWEKAYMKERCFNDPAFRTLRLLRSRTYKLLKGVNKSASTQELLGISPLELARLWDVGYGSDWRGSGDLHIDHIRPCASLNLTESGQQYLCFNYRNLQLLSAADNLSKGNSWTPEMESAWAARMRDMGWDGELFLVYPTHQHATL